MIRLLRKIFHREKGIVHIQNQCIKNVYKYRKIN